MDLNMTATEASEAGNAENNGTDGINSQSQSSQHISTDVDRNLRPDVVAGYDLCSMRPHFDPPDKHIVIASERQILYFDVQTCTLAGRANISLSKIRSNEKLVASDKFENFLYLFTNRGNILIWNLDSRDWCHQSKLPLQDSESLISCKMLSKRHHIFTVLNTSLKENQIKIYNSVSKSWKERPKHREEINDCSVGELEYFDIGCCIEKKEDENETDKKRSKKKQKVEGNKKKIVDYTNIRCLVYVRGNSCFFQNMTIEDTSLSKHNKVTIKDASFTCVKAHKVKPMVAAGDARGRIYFYTGLLGSRDTNRTKLHWHNMPVSDLCFSSTGGTLFSVGGESGCVVVWNLAQLGQKHVIAHLGMPIRHLNIANSLNQLALCFEDNTIQFMDTSNRTTTLKSFTRRTCDMYKENDYKALRINKLQEPKHNSDHIGLLVHSSTETVVTNGKTGCLQFFNLKEPAKSTTLSFLKTPILSLETGDTRVLPSDITRAALTTDGSWLAFYETHNSELQFPDVKLHIWQRSAATNRWTWIQTAERLHTVGHIEDLRFSPDGQFLISVAKDGTFHVLHRVTLDNRVNESSSIMKQMYAKGYIGKVPQNLPAIAAFSQDSSVMAMSLKNQTTSIWMIVDPYKLVYECQLSQIYADIDTSEVDNTNGKSSGNIPEVCGLHFGPHKPAESLAPLCEVRSDSIKIWNILNPQEAMDFSCKDVSAPTKGFSGHKFAAAAFDHTSDHFAVCTNTGYVLLFKLEIAGQPGKLMPLTIVDCRLPFTTHGTMPLYSHICFTIQPILKLDTLTHSNQLVIDLMNRLVLLSCHQELVAVTDKLTLKGQSASNNCNSVSTAFDASELKAYFDSSEVAYVAEMTRALESGKIPTTCVQTDRQKMFRNRIKVRKMLKQVLTKIPSHNLPDMEILAPMIIDKLVLDIK